VAISVFFIKTKESAKRTMMEMVVKEKAIAKIISRFVVFDTNIF